MNKVYMCIDLKNFYASVECVERGLDPLNTNLVVADESRTEKTVCLAITPSLKQYGLGGRARLFEVIQKVKEVNYKRRKENNYKKFSNKSFLDNELPTKENYKKSRRICRGLFKTNNGKLINSDINGSYQILKKVIGNYFVAPTSIRVLQVT